LLPFQCLGECPKPARGRYHRADDPSSRWNQGGHQRRSAEREEDHPGQADCSLAKAVLLLEALANERGATACRLSEVLDVPSAGIGAFMPLPAELAGSSPAGVRSGRALRATMGSELGCRDDIDEPLSQD
jgi:hypothetical protein